MISLVSSCGETFESEEYACMHCKTLAYFIEEDEYIDCIPLPNVTSPILGKILTFFDERLKVSRQYQEESQEVRAHSLRQLEEDSTAELLELLLAANYLNCEVLIDLITTVVASRIAGKSRDEMREILGIENDFTEEEEAQILAENAWCFA
jgi:S-phase kinase-associated protein 1